MTLVPRSSPRVRGLSARSASLRAREGRQERFVRAGAGYASPSNTLELPEAAATPPIASGEEVAPALVVLALEFIDGVDYPEGTLLDTTEFQLTLTAAGALELVGAAGITVDISDPSIFGGGVPPAGVHFIAVFFRPDPVDDGDTWLFLDGDLIGQGVGAFTDWSSGTWDYMQSVADVGSVGPLEVYPGFVPGVVG